MKTIATYVAVGVLALVPLVSFAAEFRAGEHSSANTGEQIMSDLYLAGDAVTSASAVQGDVTGAGATVVISGPVSADVLAAGGTVTVLSSVGDDVRVAAGTLVIGGAVAGDVVGMGGTVTLSGPGVAGDVSLAGGTIHIDAPIGGNVRIAGGEVYLNAPINGNVEIRADKVTLGGGAVINGSLNYKASGEMTKDDGAVVRGTVTFEQNEMSSKKSAAQAAAIFFSTWTIGSFFALLIGSLVVGLWLKRFSKTCVERVRMHPWLEIGRGLLVAIALPILSIVACVTLIGIPFGVLGFIGLVALYILVWFMSPVVIGALVWRYFTTREEVSWKTITSGAVVYTIVGMIPVVGPLVIMALSFAVLGVFAAIKWEQAQEWR